MPLKDYRPPLKREFVAHFGEMGSRRGINRTVGQICALLFISQRALNADEFADTLEPTLAMLRTALLETPKTDAERHAQARMREMHDLIDRLMTWFDDVQKLAPETAMQLMGMGATVTKVLELKDRLTGKGGARSDSKTNAA